MKQKPPTIIESTHGIVVIMTAARDPEDPRYPEASTITSDLHAKMPEDAEGGSEEDSDYDRHQAAVETLQKIILAHAEAGIDITTAQYQHGTDTAVELL